jgi:hypothetical protein
VRAQLTVRLNPLYTAVGLERTWARGMKEGVPLAWLVTTSNARVSCCRWASSTLRVRAQSIWSQRRNEEARPLFKAGEYGGSARARLSAPLGVTAVAQAEVDTLAPLVGLVDPAHPAAAAAPPLPATLRARVAVTSRLPLHELVRLLVSALSVGSV